MRLTARRRTIGTLAVALIAAALAPGASAGYRFTYQEAARLAQQSGQSASSTTVVRPNPDQQGTQSGSAGADPAGSASGRTRCDPPGGGATGSGALLQAPGGRSLQQRGLQRVRHARPSGCSHRPTVGAPGDGFDYGAAAVGAGLAVTIIAPITAAASRRRRRRPQHGYPRPPTRGGRPRRRRRQPDETLLAGKPILRSSTPHEPPKATPRLSPRHDRHQPRLNSPIRPSQVS